jgi:hypothetical protein
MNDDHSEQQSPLFTVAIPTCNGQAHIAAALHGILAQASDVAFDLLISDDRSDDATLEEVRTLAADKATIHRNEVRLGLAGNWNRCLSLACTRFLTIFHQDDVMLPGHLKAHAQAFAADDKVGLVASASTVIDAHNQPVPPDVVRPGGLGPENLVINPGELALRMTFGNPLRCSAISLRLAACQDVGDFDPGYRYVLDWDYWLRVSRRWRVAWLAEPTVQVRWHPKSETHRFKTGTADLDETIRLMNELFTIDLSENPRIQSLRRAANQTLARAFLNRAQDALRANQPTLAREALSRALSLSPRAYGTLLRDPRLGLQMTTLALAPRLATSWFAR